MHTVNIRTFKTAEWRKYRKLRLNSLTESPDAFGSWLDREQKFTDREWSSRFTLSDSTGINFPLPAEKNEDAVGLAWGRIHLPDKDTVHIYQMWVAPERRGEGTGRLLLNEIQAWAKSQNAKTVALAVACGNSPALELYSSTGFLAVSEIEPLRQGSDIRTQQMHIEL